MSVAEVVHRVSEKAGKVRARNRLEGWDRYREDGVLPQLPGLQEALDGVETAMRQKIADAAGNVIAGRFAALGQDWPIFTFSCKADSIWHLDPVTGEHWPGEDYCFDIPYRDAHGIGDVKYVWEFGRLQFLQPVAAHARLSGAPDAVAFLDHAIQSWHASNPPFRGVGWSSGIELSLRVVSLLVVTSFAGNQLAPATQSAIVEILRAHAFWLERYPSRFSSANNHLVSEDAALFLLGVACDFLPKQDRLKQEAATGLAREAGRQILVDGVPAEQSPTYGALTAELILLCAFVADANGTPFGESVMERLGAFAAFILWLADTDGHVPGIGDDDEGRVLTLACHEDRYPASVAASIASFLRREDLVPPHEPDLRNALLPASAPAPAPEGTRSFATGGYTVHRGTISGRRILAVMDHAPLGYLSIAAHGHADALAITLSVDDQPLLIDAGTYLYHAGHEWRSWFRSTRAHNTLTVESADQSISSGAFNWSHKAETRLEKVTDAPFSISASHNGYLSRFGIRHRRRIIAEPNALIITDTLEGAPKAKTVEIVFQLGIGVTAKCEGTVIICAINSSPLARIHFPPDGVVRISCGEDSLDGGWMSPSFGKKMAAVRLSWSGKAGLNDLITKIEICETSVGNQTLVQRTTLA
jgi:hypothetical protein